MDPVSHSAPPNYEDIAREACCSKATVSRTLQGYARVAPATRARILDAARRLGYRHDPQMAALSRRRWPRGANPPSVTLAWLYEETRSSGRPESRPEFLAAQARARELGYALEPFAIRQFGSPRALSRILYHRGIQGVLVLAFDNESRLDLHWEQFFTVFVGPENDAVHVHNVQADFRGALRIAVNQAVERGYRRLGLALMDHQASGTDDPFLAQALLEQRRLRRRFGSQPPLFEFAGDANAAAACSKWVHTHRPEVIIASGVMPYYWLRDAPFYGTGKRGWRIPEEVAFMLLRNPSPDNEIAHIDLGESTQGSFAVDRVHHQLQYGVVGLPQTPMRTLVPPRFVDGATLPIRSR